MKKPLPAFAVVLVLLILNPQLSIFAQGSITPPGPPGPTLKTLDQIEPRFDLARLTGDADNHVYITKAGAYYLSTNLAVSKTYGITIAATGVTLDLNGFEIARVSGSGGDGIRILGGCDRATVRNGTIRGFNYGINGSVLPYAKGCLFEKLAMTGCFSNGIYAGESARVMDCRAHDNVGNGIYAEDGAVISGCTAQNNHGAWVIHGGFGSAISRCTAQDNQSTLVPSQVISGGSSCIISGCTALDNQGGYGIYGGSGSTISGCAVYNNSGTYSGLTTGGIVCGNGCVIIGCTSSSNSNTNSPATADRGIGIYANSGSTVKDCCVTFNQGDGIRVEDYCLVEGNTSKDNGDLGDGAGIHSVGTRSRIEANTVTGNDRGIHVDLSAGLIIRNSAGGNTINYVIAADNVFGAIVNRTAPGSAAVSGNSAASSAGTTDPWANFSY